MGKKLQKPKKKNQLGILYPVKLSIKFNDFSNKSTVNLSIPICEALLIVPPFLLSFLFFWGGVGILLQNVIFYIFIPAKKYD